MSVAIIKNDGLDYCRDAPFHPQERYPEYPFTDVSDRNACYAEVRNLLYRLGLDRDNYGKASWNPLGEIIKPGDHVFVKPNLVTHKNKVGGTDAVITQGSVIRAALDYVYIALQGKGSIAIGDAPFIDTDFEAVLQITGIDRIADYYSTQGAKVGIVDLRKEIGQLQLGRIVKREINGDPLGYTAVDLKSDSAHAGMAADCGKYRVAFYDRSKILPHHTADKHEYLIANSILDADVVVSIPKLKTHAKTGISCALKNLVGINGLKDWLPHHRAGPAEKGGDEYRYSDLRKDVFTRLKDDIPASKSLVRIIPMRATGAMIFVSKKIVPFKDDFDAGSWFGNDTLPRTIADLNKVLYYADHKGVMRDTRQRKTFILVDGIVAGEKEGPMSNDARKCGVLLAGCNPVEIDLVSSALMGFDYRKMLTFKYAMGKDRYSIFDGEPDDLKIEGDSCRSLRDVFLKYNCGIIPANGWLHHIEYVPEEGPVAAVPVAS